MPFQGSCCLGMVKYQFFQQFFIKTVIDLFRIAFYSKEFQLRRSLTAVVHDPPSTSHGKGMSITLYSQHIVYAHALKGTQMSLYGIYIPHGRNDASVLRSDDLRIYRVQDVKRVIKCFVEDIICRWNFLYLQGDIFPRFSRIPALLRSLSTARPDRVKLPPCVVTAEESLENNVFVFSSKVTKLPANGRRESQNFSFLRF